MQHFYWLVILDPADIKSVAIQRLQFSGEA